MLPFGAAYLRIAFAVGFLWIAAGCSQERAAADSEPASKFALFDLEGKEIELWKASPARTTVVVFTRTDCPVSNRFAPEIRRLHKTYHSRGVDFYLVYVDPHQPAEEIRRHLDEYQYPCQGLLDPKHTLVAHCQATITPEAAVFDRDRNIAYRGRINDLYVELGKSRPEPTTHDLADAVEAILSGRPVATPQTKAIGCPIADLR